VSSLYPSGFKSVPVILLHYLNSTQGMGGGAGGGVQGGGAVGGGIVAGQGGPPLVNQGQGVGSWAGVAGQHVQHAQGQQGQGQGGKRKNDETGTMGISPQFSQGDLGKVIMAKVLSQWLVLRLLQLVYL
jgi:hypothetical protein